MTTNGWMYRDVLIAITKMKEINPMLIIDTNGLQF
jgi:hypothetical protein